ncbi:MAG: sn-glycerol-3-phosphate ABC transporter ATP-binding protein UgpC [Firmicutes bacterium]|nr:sn-glycerol-3-phosphate ABC transporter ATP-binding protein UgpC [Bacillota bacterium]
MATVQLHHVTKQFGDVTAVHDFSLEIDDGEFLVLVGPSGCGKSTLLRVVAGLEEVTSGEIYIDDRLVNHVAPKDRDVAMVFQNYALYPHMNVYDNLAFGLRMRRVARDEIDRRVRQAAEILGLADLLRRRPAQLSGGQRQRVALGRAIVREPKVFLMDEPLSNLDAKLRVEMRTELARLHQRLRVTTIYVTHDQTEAMTMGSRIVVMKDGRIQQVASPLELYEQPANLFVAGFIGSPPMNFVRGTLEPRDGDLWFAAAGISIRVPGALAGATAGLGGHPIVLGVRPEDILVDPERVRVLPDHRVEALVEVVEPLGADAFVHLLAGEQRLTARVPGRVKVRVGDRLTVAPDPDRIHLFDPATEQALSRAATSP